MRDKHHIAEEPDAPKGARPVLKGDGGRRQPSSTHHRLLEQRKTAYEATGTGPTLYEAAGHLWGAQSRAPVAGRRA